MPSPSRRQSPKNGKRAAIFLFIGVLLVAGLISALYFRDDIHNLLAYNQGDQPTHDAAADCSWIKKTFSKLTLFEQGCPSVPPEWQLSESQGGSVLTTSETKYGYSFKLQIFEKDAAQKPSDVMQEWYAKLTPEQQQKCSIQNADEPVDHFSNGKLLWTENPHPMPHKTRYKVAIRPELIKQIWDEYGGDPGDAPDRDYLCGRIVGTTWSGHPPYFEFDDRSPDKYLLVGSYGLEGPQIDLNSLRF
jgi:hypothetical protein